MKSATKKELKVILEKLERIYSDLEQIEDPAFEDDDSDIVEVMDNVDNAKRKIDEMVGGE